MHIGAIVAALAAAVVLIVKSPAARRILDVLLNAIVSRLHFIPSIEDGKNIRGPAYKFPNGNTKDKFLRGRENSYAWNEKYGSIYRIWAGSTPEVVLTDPKDVQALYSHASNHTKDKTANIGWLFSQLLGEAIGLINGNRWTKLRKTLDPMFSHKQSLQYLDSFNDSATTYCKNLDQYAVDRSSSDKQHFTVNASHALMRFPYYEVAKLFFTDLNQHEVDRLWDLGQLFTAVFAGAIDGGINRSPLAKWLNLPSWQRARDYIEQWEAFTREAVQRRVEAGIQDPLVSLWQSAEAGEIDKQEVLHTLAESLFANLDVTTHVISSCVILLADNANVQADLRAEFAAHAYDVNGYLGKRDTLLHYCLLESLRLQPVPAFTLPDKPPRERIVAGYRIPKDTTILIDSYAINIRNPFWGPDSRVYRPSRFAKIPPQQLRYNLTTFGYGSRKCLGYNVGDKMVHALVYQLFSQYEVSVRPNMKQKNDEQFNRDKSNWLALYDVELDMKRRV
ncbi:Cytochrome p450 monooxygenase [Lasiodiplodia theobromae]|uniref:Cytochrome p450 monooxygenase n=1 Tax=Lasiodiplodia theobromae TaxID=45133 RepID=UPI0015C32985|nr:Cytochrome p450 monooxygenase [Lasiodiplodia theobromae]KAF4537676.1 Cytochrome p450 monooxygenase [Lasiodiplodia theobromae]